MGSLLTDDGVDVEVEEREEGDDGGEHGVEAHVVDLVVQRVQLQLSRLSHRRRQHLKGKYRLWYRDGLKSCPPV